MANSFSQQLKAKSTQQQQGRLTRTQRQVVEQERQKQQRFEQLRSQAQAISENVFVEKDVTEKYYEYVPKSYLDRKGNITRDWQRMSEKNKRNIIKNTSARDLVSFERTRTYKDPFTFEEYKTEYSKLNPELQQFFTSPQEITSTEKAKITAKIDVWKAQIEERKQKIAEYEANWSSKSKSYREKHRESYREKIRKYNDDIEEYQDRISELESKSGEIEKGYKAEDLIEYAYSKADYRRSRQEARKSAEKQFQEDLASGKLDQTIEQLNKFRGIGKSGLTYKEYSTAVERYNKEVEYKQGLQKFAERVGGFENLPEWAQERLSPEAYRSLKLEKAGASTITLSGEQKPVQTPSVISEYKPTTQEEELQKRFLETQRTNALSKISFVAKDVLSRLGINFDKTETSAPKIETETKITISPTGESGTAIIETKPTELSQTYMNEIWKLTDKSNKEAQERFENYQKKIDALETTEITPEKISEIKSEEQSLFSQNMKKYQQDFQDVYSQKLEDVSKSKTLSSLKAVPFGIGTWAGEKWYGLVEKEKKFKGTVEIPTEQERNKRYFERYKLFKLFGVETPVSKYLGITKGIDIAGELTNINQFTEGIYYGTKRAIVENRYTFGAKAIGTAGLVAGGTVLATYSGGVASVGSSKLFLTASKILQGVYGASVGARVIIPDYSAYDRGLVLGEIAGKELIPMAVGGFVGSKIGKEGVMLYEKYKTFKAKPEYISATKRVRMEVLKGEENFPTADQSRHLSEFEKSKFSLLTDEKGGKLKVTRKFRVVDEDLGTTTTPTTREQYNPRKIFDMKPTYETSPTSTPFDIDFERGIITFNKARGYTRVQKLEILRSYFGNKYSLKLGGNVFSLTKYVPKEAFNKLGLSVGSHATPSGRFADVGEQMITRAGTSELPAQYFSSEDSLYFALGKSQSYSLYGGSVFTPSAKPYIERITATGFKEVPKGFKPKYTKAEVIAILKEKVPEYPLKWITRSKGSYWKEASYFLEKGRITDLIVIGRKSEIEAGLLFGSVAERTAQRPFYTRVANKDFYQSLEKVNRMGNVEYISRVQKFEWKDIISPSTLKVKLWQRFAPSQEQFLINLRGRSIGSFAPMRKIGAVVPIERYTLIPPTTLEKQTYFAELDEIVGKLRKTTTPKVTVPTRTIDADLTAKIRNIQISSIKKYTTTSFLYSEPSALMTSFKGVTSKSQKYYPTSSYSYSLKSAISSLLSSAPSSKIASSKSQSYGSSLTSSPFDSYYSGGSYSPISYKSTPSVTTPKIPLFKMQNLKKKIKGKQRITPEIYGLLPDFTARAIGLSPQEFNIKDVNKAVRKLQTGFEIRTGGRIKGITEKNLMKEVMLKL